MARFIDLDEEEDGGAADSLAQQHLRHDLHRASLSSDPATAVRSPEAPPDLPTRIDNPITRAFSCYPIVLAIVSAIDLNTLDSLARASFYIHNALIQYRRTLLHSTLHCINEHVPVDHEETLRYRARAINLFYMDDGRSCNGKSGDCARDLVGPCRRCGDVVCRNCAVKPPASVAFKERHRRLCIACTRAPIAELVKPPLDPELTLDCDDVRRAVCTCVTDAVWLCQPCGRGIRAADHEYGRIWRWRSHYGEVLGGLGTGIGDGDRGVTCGRETGCCAAKEVEQEVDCDAADAKDGDYASWADLMSVSPGSSSSASTPGIHHANGGSSSSASHGGNPLEAVLEDFRHERTPSPQLRTGYQRHEIEGIGGVVKRKLVRMVRVGACVPEWKDERGTGRKALVREMNGEARSWCGWCWRVIPGQHDLDEVRKSA